MLYQQPVDCPMPGPAQQPPEGAAFPTKLEQAPGDIVVIKRQWGAFHGTVLDLQSRRRGIKAQYATRGMRVNAASPGPILTRLVEANL